MKKFLAALELDPNGQYTPEQIKKQWRKLCQVYHPDKETGDEEKFKLIMHAYNVLTDPEYRAEHERNEAQEMLDLDIRLQVPISFEQAFFGFNFNLNYNIQELGADRMFVRKEVEELETLLITIPKFSMMGYQKVFKGKGVKREDKRGNAEVNVIVEAHPKFRADERGNIHSMERVSLNTLLRGGKVEVATMFGVKTLKIKPATRPGERIAIKRCGADEADHIVTLDVAYPTQEELKEEKWTKFKPNWEIDEEIRRDNETDAEMQKGFRSRGGLGGGFDKKLEEEIRRRMTGRNNIFGPGGYP